MLECRFEIRPGMRIAQQHASISRGRRGSQRPLTPLLQDEIYRIGREALRNAFRHTHADQIEVEIRYDDGMFRLRIRDDGKGIDSSALEEGACPGHWGLPGTVERAKGISGRLKIWSEVGTGSEVELTLPARVAYVKPAPKRNG
jgi:signal transduction histidine kinase